MYIVPIGIPIGLIKYISEYEKENIDFINVIFLNALRILIISSLVFTLIISIFSSYISYLIFDDTKYFILVLILALSIPFSTITSFLDSYLRGLKNINLLVKILISVTIVSFVLTMIFVLLFNLEGVVIGALMGSIVSMLVYFFTMRKNYLIPKLKIFTKFNKEIISNIVKIGFASLIVGAISQLVLLIIRIITINNMGVYGNGIYQSVMGISLNYFGFVYVLLYTYSFPKISSLKTNDEVINEINVNFRYILFLMIPLVAMIFVFRELVIALLFTKDFIASQSLYKYQFIGDLLKALSWVVGLWLIPKLKLFLWVLLDLILSINFIIIYILLLNFYSNGLESLAIAYLISNAIHFLLNYFVARRYLKFRFQLKNLSATIAGFILLIILVGISENNVIFGYICVFPSLFFWFAYAIKKSEWIFVKNTISEFISNKFN